MDVELEEECLLAPLGDWSASPLDGRPRVLTLGVGTFLELRELDPEPEAAGAP